MTCNPHRTVIDSPCGGFVRPKKPVAHKVAGFCVSSLSDRSDQCESIAGWSHLSRGTMNPDCETRAYEVYMHTNRTNGKAYIGITCNGIRTRLYSHESAARRGSRLPFHRAIKKYGIDAFDTSVLATCAGVSEATRLEQRFISQYKTFGRNGYNATEGGEGTKGVAISEDRRKAISMHFSALPRTDQHRQRISKALSGASKPYMAELNRARLAGKKQTEEVKAKSIAALEKAKSIWVGSQHTEKSKMAMRQAKSKQIAIYRPSGYVEIVETTLRALAQENEISASALSHAASNGQPIAKKCPLFGCVLVFENR